MVITSFLTHQVTKTGDFTQEIVGHTGTMFFQMLGPTSHILRNKPAKPGTRRRLPRIGPGCQTEDTGRTLGWRMKKPAATPHIPAAVLKRPATCHSSPPRCSEMANQYRVGLFSPGESPNGVISAEGPARILGPTRCTSGRIPMLQPGNLLILRPKNGPARGE